LDWHRPIVLALVWQLSKQLPNGIEEMRNTAGKPFVSALRRG